MGVGIAILLTVVDKSNKIAVKELIYEPGQLPLEQDAPELLLPNKVTILIPYGSLFFASVSTFEEQLPELSDESRHAVVILNLRGYTDLGSTFLLVVKRYAERLHEQDCQFMMTGVGDHILDQLENTGFIKDFGRSNVFRVTERVRESTLAACDLAEEWIQDRIEVQGEDQVVEDTQ